MKKHNTLTASGFPEFSPKEELVRQKWITIIREVYDRFGFHYVETPLVEREENLLGKGGNPKEIYALKRHLDTENDASHSGNLFRFDHTVPLGLYVARHQNEIGFPFRRQTLGPVLRGERAQKGRFRQFDQYDADIIGKETLSLMADAEMVAMISCVFKKIEIGDFVIKINNRKILIGILEDLDIPTEKIMSCIKIIDDQEKVSPENLREKFLEIGINEKTQEALQKRFSLKGSAEQKLDALLEISQEKSLEEAIYETKDLFEKIKAFGVNPKNYELDFSLARGLDYYTGMILETKIIDKKEFGTVCAGGRYDGLAEMFTGKKMPGVGISIGITRLLSVFFSEKKKERSSNSKTKYLVVSYNQSFDTQALTVAQDLRQKGNTVEFFTEEKKIGKKFEFAEKSNIPFVCIIGDTEVEEGFYTEKDMQQGTQKKVPFNFSVEKKS